MTSNQLNTRCNQHTHPVHIFAPMSTKKHTLRVYPSRKVKGQWGWTLIAPNGKKIATCGELYKSKAHAVTMANNLWHRFNSAELVVGSPKKAKPKSIFKAGTSVEVTGGERDGMEGIITRRSLKKGEWRVCSSFSGYTYDIPEAHLKVIK